MTAPESITITLDELAKAAGSSGGENASEFWNGCAKRHRQAGKYSSAALCSLIADKLTPPVPEPDPDRQCPIVRAANGKGGVKGLWRRSAPSEGQGLAWVRWSDDQHRRWSELYDVEIVFEGVQQ